MPPTLVATPVVLVLAFVAGRRVERAVRGWNDLQGRKAEIPILRAAVRSLTVKALGYTALTAAIAAWSLWTLASDGEECLLHNGHTYGFA